MLLLCTIEAIQTLETLIISIQSHIMVIYNVQSAGKSTTHVLFSYVPLIDFPREIAIGSLRRGKVEYKYFLLYIRRSSYRAFQQIFPHARRGKERESYIFGLVLCLPQYFHYPHTHMHHTK